MRRRNGTGERGAQTVEFALLIIPLLVIVAFFLDVAWFLFAKATLQFAVQMGVRYAITGQTNGSNGQDASIKAVVQDSAFSFLSGPNGLSYITVNYYSPSNLSAPLSGTGSNAGGNIVSVSVKNVPVTMLIPALLPGSLTQNFSAVSTDILEASPNGTPPAR